ncbi:MAG TPA: FmdB family zinc ribbon protein [Povalibacter sp.]|nr:FmdB family zinc ribbon protein [Povalibacter sp.]
MPFYEYQCSTCQHHVEVLQKISDAPLRKCPECGKSTLKRLISAPVFRLKGGGWYETDFKSDNEQKRNLHGREDTPDSKSEGANASSGSTSTEAAKPATAKSVAKPAAAKPTSKTRTAKPAARSKPAAKPVSRAKPAAKKRTSR